MSKVTRKKLYRCLAYIGDLIILNAFSTMIWRFIPETIQTVAGEEVYIYMFKVLAILLIEITICVFYSVIMYKYFGASFGKFAFAISIVDSKSKKAQLNKVIKREFTKWTMFFGTFGIYGVYCLYAIITSKRLYHDIVADTYIK